MRLSILFSKSTRQCWFLVPIFAPFLGSIIGVIVYQLMVGWHVEGEARDKNNKAREESLKLNDVTSKEWSAWIPSALRTINPHKLSAYESLGSVNMSCTTQDSLFCFRADSDCLAGHQMDFKCWTFLDFKLVLIVPSNIVVIHFFFITMILFFFFTSSRREKGVSSATRIILIHCFEKLVTMLCSSSSSSSTKNRCNNT